MELAVALRVGFVAGTVVLGLLAFGAAALAGALAARRTRLVRGLAGPAPVDGGPAVVNRGLTARGAP